MRLPREIGPIHFVGIGGIGMSGIAEVLLNLGYTVQGSDASDNYNLDRLRKNGARVSVGHKAENVDGAEVVVVSTAIKRDNPELTAARERRIPVVRRAEMLAELMRLKSCVAIAGTHGKTTTTTMVATLLDAGGLDPTVINGGIINAYGSNARLGAGDWMVVEADESDGTFLKLPTEVAIVTNVDPEHLDHFKTFEAVQDAFRHFVENLPFYGFAVMCIDHPVVQTLVGKIEDRRIITYGENPQADVRFVDLTPTGGGSKFKVTFHDRKTGVVHEIADLVLPMPGRHNASNATAAIAVARELGVSDEAIRKAIAGFGGVKRRFTKTGEWDGVTVIDDYGHHPVEIAAVLKAARESTNGKIVAVVQPHRYTPPAVAVRRILHLFQRCGCGDRRRGLRRRRDADPGHRPRPFRRGPACPRPPRGDPAAGGVRSRRHRQGRGDVGRSRRVPWRRQHHAMGVCLARRVEGAGVGQ
ncbi:UDP-N-acetylmuramate--alanine ligase [Bradyrhizobium sp. F1.13.4]